MGLAVLGFSNQALAQCTPTLTPTGGETINCTGTTTDSIDGANAGNVIVNVTGGALMQAPVGHAIALGTNANINVTGNSVIQSYMDTIRAKGGSTVTVEYGSGVQAFTDAAIVYDGNAGETFTVNLAGGLYGANGTAVAFGQSAARLIVHGTAAPGGTFIAGAGTDDQFIAEGTGTFDANWIGSLLFGFDKYEKTGTGTWTLTGSTTAVTPWTISGGTLNVSANNQLGDNAGALIFNGGTLQLGSTFNTARNVTLGAAGGTINTNSYGLTISSIISGTGSLTKTGTGNLLLSNANTYTGGTTVSAGMLIGTTSSLQGNITNNASLGFSQAGNGTYAGIISGSGGVAKGGNGTVTFSGANTYTGGTTINLGVLNASADNNLGDASGAITLNGGTLQYGNSFNSARNIAINASGGTIDTNGSNTNLTGILSGTGTLTKTGSGTLSISTGNSYTGNKIITAGRLQGTTSSLGGNITNNAELRFNQSFNGTHSGIISGTGTVLKGGAGTATLAGANTYTGGTSITAGAINVSADNNLGNVSGDLTLNGGTLQYGAGFSSARDITLGASDGTIDTNGFNSTLTGVISGTGSLTKTGTGELTLSGANTYTGGTTITNGVIIVSADQNLGDVSGALTLDGGTLRYAASFDTARNLFLGAGGGTIDIGIYNSVWSGIISGTGSLVKLGTGTLTLTGSNSYTGGTIINSAQVIAASEDANLGNGGNIVFDGGTLQYGASFDNARNMVLQAGGGTIDTNGFDTTLSGAASGAGGLIKTGGGILTLTGASTYLGGTIVTDGILNVSAHNNLGDTSGALTLDGGTLQYGAAFNSARTIVLGAANGTIDTNGFNSTLSGAISGTGDLVKSGSGALTLSGANTSTGSTSVTGGTLRLNADNNIGSGDLTLDGGALAFNTAFNSARDITLGASNGVIDTNGFNVILSGIFSGAGDFTKSGAGTLTLTGTNTYNGATDITAGKLVLNGSIANSAATIAHGAAIGGSGTTGNLVINGRAEPGNSIGTLNVAGDVTFHPGSVYEVEVSDTPNDSDKIIATGALIINGGSVNVLPSAGTYADVTHYTILQGASRTGMFTGVNSSFAFLDPTLSYTGTTVDLTLTRNDNAFNIVAKDKVQQGVADAVENLGSGNDLYNAFVGLSSDQASKALDTLSGEHNTGLAASTMKSSAILRNIVMTRVQNMARGGDATSSNLMALRPIGDGASSITELENFALMEPAAGGSALDAPSHNRGWWGEVFGSMGHSDRQGTAPSQNRESAGALFGMDTQLDDQTVIGAFGGWERGEIYTDSQAANTDVESWHGGLYGSYVPGNAWRFSGGFSGSFHQMDTTRHVSFGSFDDTAKGETEGFTADAYAEAGYTIDYAPVALEPFIGLNVTHTYIGSYREKDGGAANLKVDSVSQTTPGHTIGLRAAKAVRVEDVIFNVRGKIGWDHNYGDLSAKSDMRFLAGNTYFTVDGTESARDSAVMGFGIDANLAPQTKLYVDYDGSYSADDTNHGMTLGVKIAF